MVKSYRGSGSAGYHSGLLLGLLVYGYATGVFSSRKLERQPTIRSPSGSLLPTIIPITTPSRRFGGAAKADAGMEILPKSTRIQLKSDRLLESPSQE